MEKVLDNEESSAQFEYFASFNSQESAEVYTAFLEEEGIPYQLHKAESLIDESIVGTAVYPRITLKILDKDFKRVTQLIEQMVEQDEGNLEEYYLNELTTPELFDVLDKQEEWSIQDVVMAKKLLRSRGEEISEEDIQAKRNARLEEQRKGKEISGGIMVGYFIATLLGMLVLHLAVIIAGLGMGWYFWKGKEVDMDGHRHFVYEENTRNRGFLMLATFVMMLFVVLVLVLALGYQDLGFAYLLYLIE